MARDDLIRLRRGRAQVWEQQNPTLAYGEPGFERDTNRLKIGDGETPWTGLAAINDGGGGGGPCPVLPNLRTAFLNSLL